MNQPIDATHDDETLERGRTYLAMMNEIPPHVVERWAIMKAAGRTATIDAIEDLREVAITGNHLGLKWQQLVQFGQLLVLRAEDPARLHAKAAIHHGATFQDLIGIAETAFITGGVLAYSLGVRIAGDIGGGK
jgi:4-carboxymuconolactone decarboxylase